MKKMQIETFKDTEKQKRTLKDKQRHWQKIQMQKETNRDIQGN